MPVDHREKPFEEAIQHHLLNDAGYAHGNSGDFDPDRAIAPQVFLDFVRDTQPETWQALEKLHGQETPDVFLADLCKALDSSAGSLAAIRHGFKCFGKRIHAAYFAPAHGMNPDAERLYAANRLTVTRQVHYSTNLRRSSAPRLVCARTGKWLRRDCGRSAQFAVG